MTAILTQEVSLGCYADASLLLLGAEEAESAAGQEVAQHRLNLTACILVSTAGQVWGAAMGADAMGLWCVYGGRGS